MKKLAFLLMIGLLPLAVQAQKIQLPQSSLVATPDQVRSIQQSSRVEVELFLKSPKIKVLEDAELSQYFGNLINQSLQFIPVDPRAGDLKLKATVVVADINDIDLGAFPGGDVIINLNAVCTFSQEDTVVLMVDHEVVHIALLHAVGQTLFIREVAAQEMKLLEPSDLTRKQRDSIQARLSKQIQDLIFLHECEADLIGAKAAVSMGYLITDWHSLRKTFNKKSKNHPEPISRAQAILKEMVGWQKLCPGCQAKAHSTSDLLVRKCQQYGF